MNALRVLTGDHRALAQLYQRFLSARSSILREQLARRLLREAELHLAVEERYLCPIARERAGARLEDFAAAKLSLAELGELEFEDWRFEDQLGSFVQQLLERSKLEERHFFPILGQRMSRAELDALGRLIQNAREVREDAPGEGGALVRALRSGLERVFAAVLASRPQS